jgi:Zn-dependent M28 family amino/carboxypeptidase
MLNGAALTCACLLAVMAAPAPARAQRPARQTPGAAPLDAALASLTPDLLAAPLRFLADDLLEGRAPGTRGGELAARYLASQFAALGLHPAAPDGSFYQWVSLVGLQSDVSFVVGAQGRTLVLRNGTEIVAWPERADSVITLDAEIVFAGYGIAAPEWDWDDYKGTAQTGRVVMVLAGEPTLDDTTLFRGQALTSYGLWQHKIEQAARMGAAGVIVVWAPGSSPLSWEAVRRSWSGEHLLLDRPAQHSLRFAAWMTQETAQRLVEATGKDYGLLLRRAALRAFRPVDIGARVAADLRSRVRRFRAPNVVARLEGADSLGRQETVVLAAHYDHLGLGLPEAGDSIYNGAVDNASGVAVLLGAATALSRLPTPPRRSVVFFAPTAEEAGRLGSLTYLAQPAGRLEQTVALISLDQGNVWGAAADIMAIGAEWSTLDSTVRAAARAESLTVSPEPQASLGDFYIGGHFAFAQAGIPAVLLRPGLQFRNRPASFGREAWLNYLAERYHRPSDEVRPDFDFQGLLEQARVVARLAWILGQASEFPSYRPGSEFRAAGQRLRRER